jgi:hypothetical protein
MERHHPRRGIRDRSKIPIVHALLPLDAGLENCRPWQFIIVSGGMVCRRCAVRPPLLWQCGLAAGMLALRAAR